MPRTRKALTGEETGLSAAGGLVPVGKIGRPHGVKGELKVYPYSGNPAGLQAYTRLLVEMPENGATESYGLSSCRSQGQFAVVKFAGIETRDAAALLTGRRVLVARREMPEPAGNEFYWHELQGMTVVTAQGRRLGTVSSLMATGAHDILVVADRGREYLIPALDEFIVAIDAGTATITVDPPEGLLEMND